MIRVEKMGNTAKNAGSVPRGISTVDGCPQRCISYDMETDIEKRLVHRQGFVLRHLSRHAVDGELAMALPREDGTVGLKITRPDGLFGKDIGLSDSIDESPCWHPDGSKRLVFQSSAIGRNEHGYAVGQSPYRIEVLDLKSEELRVLHEEENFDLLQPSVQADGSMLFIRRPYKATRKARSVISRCGEGRCSFSVSAAANACLLLQFFVRDVLRQALDFSGRT